MVKKKIAEKIHDVLFAVSVYQSEEQLRAFCQNRLQLTPRETNEALEEARRRIQAAAEYDLTEELGQALVRNDYLYRQAVMAQDLKTAARVQRDRWKLLGLQQAKQTAAATVIDYDADAAEMEADLTDVRDQLESLRIAPEGIAITDLARAVVIRYLELEKKCLSQETPKLAGGIE